jgi:hypothetical protein
VNIMPHETNHLPQGLFMGQQDIQNLTQLTSEVGTLKKTVEDHAAVIRFAKWAVGFIVAVTLLAGGLAGPFLRSYLVGGIGRMVLDNRKYIFEIQEQLETERIARIQSEISKVGPTNELSNFLALSESRHSENAGKIEEDRRKTGSAVTAYPSSRFVP